MSDDRVSAVATWAETNQRAVLNALAAVRTRLEARVGTTHDDVPVDDAAEDGSALGMLCDTFGLSAFERAILVLCAGVELDASIATLCAAAQGDPARAYPTFGLALSALDAPHWSALAPNGTLRRWRLVEPIGLPATPLTMCPLRIDERVLHFLAGVSQPDERLRGILVPIARDGPTAASHETLAADVSRVWTEASHPMPLVHLSGADLAARQSVALAACERVGLALLAVHADALPNGTDDGEAMLRLLEREAALTTSALYIDVDDLDAGDTRSASSLARVLERLGGAIFLGSREGWRTLRRPTVAFDVQRPSRAEQRTLWRSVLGDTPEARNGHLERLIEQFDLGGSAIRSVVRASSVTTTLWDAARMHVRPRMERLAQRIPPAAGWRDLVLPAAQLATLHEIATHVRHRGTVYDAWGFGTRGARGLGVSALFAGPSGTGKTMAAEVLAAELHLDLYRIDLSQVVSKYIGETEKNLQRVFDAAEEGGALLLFDEADALFGKRSEVKDSHDRYANIEVSYLLQRMESYRGLAILTTNAKTALDPAFLRRLRFVVSFPFPDASSRAEIWRRAFPDATPREPLDADRLARWSVTGGNIRNIALGAAFLAAEGGGTVTLAHVVRAARAEYAKLEKPFAELDAGAAR